jgi:hypothetical protein
VDDNWNITSIALDVVRLTSSDEWAELPQQAALVRGTRTFTVTLWTAGQQTITVTGRDRLEQSGRHQQPGHRAVEAAYLLVIRMGIGTLSMPFCFFPKKSCVSCLTAPVY